MVVSPSSVWVCVVVIDAVAVVVVDVVAAAAVVASWKCFSIRLCSPFLL